MKGHSVLATLLTWTVIGVSATGFRFLPRETSPPSPSLVPSTGDDFERAITFIFEWEGGLVDHPSDRGGKTNMGITEERAKQHGLTPEQITKEKATEIYRIDYWNAAGCGDFPLPLSLACLNTAVNSGPGKALEFNELVGDGTATEEAIDYTQRQEDFYRAIVASDPSQEVFLQGWLNRSAALKAEIKRF
ncbi:glycoside hydrolase family 108 protein [Roseofilum sp. Belize Diploria]|uniref:glycoside hydrolase family 108 protein n=1 Tax=Roseofilum sp. Belize Diploria TaxID=2821501 RepID=UPI001B2A24C1|nr:glycosyl hydrolase 108 family protein [Roseofilum sp. Belize Diploria]MBP0008059.1 hypothetical protein [Roseofilum sp. Belize Diploria]